ncbi:MAG: hypothetical protein IKK47_01800 [Ruminococcus sp.]|nr:hypothetical protein [Ruminococcus sp.]
MDQLKDFMDFYNNPYSKEMTKNFGIIADYASTVLIGFSQLFDKIVKTDEESLETANYCKDILGVVSGQLQRAGIFCSVLMNDKTKNDHISIEKYLGNFISGCERILGQKFDTSVAIQKDFVVYTSSDLLDMLLLGFIRKTCTPDLAKEKKDNVLPTFDISASVKNDMPQITVNSSTILPQNSYDPFGSREFFEKFFVEFATIIAEKINARIDIGENYITIKFLPDKDPNILIFHSPKVRIANEGRTIFKIMLEDL